MSDLISRKGVVNWLENYKFENYASVGHEKEYNFIENLIKGIQNEPTVEARPSGKWRKYEDIDCVEFIKCSVCDGIFYDGDNDTFDRPYNFCPNCGADMRGGKNET